MNVSATICYKQSVLVGGCSGGFSSGGDGPEIETIGRFLNSGAIALKSEDFGVTFGLL